jgi:hypothetical protein
VEVQFPDGTVVRALPLRERRETDEWRECGLYMDEKWGPTWPAELIEWEDFGVPRDAETAASQIRAAFGRAKSGQHLEIGCAGGLGRTGTVLACMAILAGVPEDEAIVWVRRNYRADAIETAEQEAWIKWFSEHSKTHC